MTDDLIRRYPALEACRADIEAAASALIRCYEGGGKVLTCGNGGSCSDSDHIVGELMKGFMKRRPLSEEAKKRMKQRTDLVDDELLGKLQGALPAVSLPSMTALGSAFCNDVDPELVYAQAVLGLGREGDVLIAISTSGNSRNVCAAVRVAKALGLTVIALTGAAGGQLRTAADIAVCVPEIETYKVQELHLPVYHYLCAAVEERFFDR